MIQHPVITSLGLESFLPYQNSFVTSISSGTWSIANGAMYIGFKVLKPFGYKQMFVANGSAVSGNVDVGLYTIGGKRIVSSGSTAQAGTNVMQAFDITDGTLLPGEYFMGIAFDNTTATVLRYVSAVQRQRMSMVYTESSAFPLPATATFGTAAVINFPLMGITSRTFV